MCSDVVRDVRDVARISWSEICTIRRVARYTVLATEEECKIRLAARGSN